MRGLSAIGRAILTALIVVTIATTASAPTHADGGVEQRIAEFWKRVDALRPSDHLSAVDLGQWAANVIERDATARVSIADFRDSTASMQAAIERAGPAAVAISAPSAVVEQRIATFWNRVNALWPSDFVASADLGQWALNLIERDARARLTVADFRAATAGMQAAMDRARGPAAAAGTMPAGMPTVCAVSPASGPPYSCRGTRLTRLAPGDQSLIVFDGFSVPTTVVRGGLRLPDGSVVETMETHFWSGPWTTWWAHAEVLLDPNEPWATGRYYDRWTINGARYEIGIDVTGNGRTRTPAPATPSIPPGGTAPPATGFVPPPSGTVSPASGPRGTSFAYRVSGFPASTTVTQALRFPDGSTFTNTLTTSQGGEVVVQLMTDTTWAPGSYTITVSGGGASRQLTFTITPSTPSPTPVPAATSGATVPATPAPAPTSTPCTRAATGTIVGTMKWGGQPVSGIRLEVRAGQYGDGAVVGSAVSGADGRFAIGGVDPDGTWRLEIAAQRGYVEEEFYSDMRDLVEQWFDECNVFDLTAEFNGFGDELRREITGLSLKAGATIPSAPLTISWDSLTSATTDYCVGGLNTQTGEAWTEAGLAPADCAEDGLSSRANGRSFTIPALPAGNYQVWVFGEDPVTGGEGWGSVGFTVE